MFAIFFVNCCFKRHLLIIQLSMLLLLSPLLLFLILQSCKPRIKLHVSIDDCVRFIPVAFGVSDHGVTINMMRRVNRCDNILEWIIVVTAWAHLFIAQFMLDIHIIKSVFFAKLVELFADYWFYVAVRQSLSRDMTPLRLLIIDCRWCISWHRNLLSWFWLFYERNRRRLLCCGKWHILIRWSACLRAKT